MEKKIRVCSACGETMHGEDYGVDNCGVMIGVSINLHSDGLKLRRHKGTSWEICYDCWLDSLGVKA